MRSPRDMGTVAMSVSSEPFWKDGDVRGILVSVYQLTSCQGRRNPPCWDLQALWSPGHKILYWFRVLTLWPWFCLFRRKGLGRRIVNGGLRTHETGTDQGRPRILCRVRFLTSLQKWSFGKYAGIYRVKANSCTRPLKCCICLLWFSFQSVAFLIHCTKLLMSSSWVETHPPLK